ncbi:MAG: ATP-binding protein [Promethearchaeota archaeon]
MTQLNEKESIGVVLNNSNTSKVIFQLKAGWERTNKIFEGVIVLIHIKDINKNILARIDSIIPSNELFNKGNIFSEARKMGVKLPTDFAQSWVIAEGKILINIDDFSSVNIPPSPGDIVYLIDSKEAETKLFKKAKNNTKISFGYLHGYTPIPVASNEGISIPLNIDNLPMHLGIFGVTGSGKSYSTGVLIERLLNIEVIDNKKKLGFVTFPTIIIDAHGDYLCYFKEAKKNNFNYSKKLNFNLNNFRHFVFPEIYEEKRNNKENMSNIERVAVNLNLLSPREIAELIALFYHGESGVGEKQITILSQTLRKMKENEELDYNALFSNREGIERILRFILTKKSERDNLSDEEYVFSSSGTKGALERILNKFYEEIEEHHKLLSSNSPFKDENYIDEIIKNGLINIIDFSAEGSASAEINVKQFFMSYLATILFNRFRKFIIKGERKYHLLFLIEEAQIYCPSSSYNISASLAKEKLRAIATQGRKFGLSLGIITQRPSFVDHIILSMINTFIIHRSAAEDINLIKNIAGGLPQSIISKLSTLKTGNFILTGQMNFLPFPIWGEIVGSKERKIPPDIGDVKPSLDLFQLQNPGGI